MDIGIKNLVFSGGGLKGIVYIGCIEALEKYNIMKFIKKISATSIGSIFSFLILLGYKSTELKELNYKLDFSYLKDIHAENILNFPITFGIDTGDKIERLLKITVKKKGYLPNITFKQFYDITNIEFTIVGSCISKLEVCFFNYKTWPDLSIIKAIRISCGIPFLYNAVELQNEIYADGFLFDNCPINYFEDEIEHTVAFLIKSHSKYEHKLSNYIMNIFNCMTKTIEKLQLKKYEENLIKLCVKINSKLDTTKEEKDELIRIGYEKTCEYLENKKNKLKVKETLIPEIEKNNEIKSNLNTFSDLTKEINEILEEYS